MVSRETVLHGPALLRPARPCPPSVATEGIPEGHSMAHINPNRTQKYVLPVVEEGPQSHSYGCGCSEGEALHRNVIY